MKPVTPFDRIGSGLLAMLVVFTALAEWGVQGVDRLRFALVVLVVMVAML